MPDYELLKLIGSGSYGEVWLARSVTGAYRAVKVVYRRRFEDQRPFEREFNGIQKFEPVSRLHASQVAVLHVGRQADYFYYVMELADDATAAVESESELRVESRGNTQTVSQLSTQTPLSSSGPDHAFTGVATYAPRTLKSELRKRGRLPFEECVRVALSLTTALEHLHQHGLIHRDIKPSNIIFVGGVPKLADIGLVTSIDATHSFVGTEGFVPPEGPGTPQGDIYSLGKVLYEMCTGRDRQQFPELPTQLRESEDREAMVEMNEIILRACERNPSQRYQSTEEMHADLALLQAGKSVRRARGIEKRLAVFKRFALAAAVVAVLAVGVTHESKRAERAALEHVHRLHVAQGVRLMNDGDLYGSILWFGKAINLGYRDPIQEEINRLRIGTALSFSPRLNQVVFHSDMVRRAVFSPDGRRIATASDDRTAQIWDAATGEPVTPPLRHQAEVRDVEFSPDGRWLVTASNDHTARVWDAATGEPISPPLQHASYVYRATFHPNGLLVATASEDRTARIWDARTGEPVGPPLQHEDRLQCVCFSPNGDVVATASRDGTARIWRVQTVRPVGGSPPTAVFALTDGLELTSKQAVSPVATTNSAVVILHHAGEVEDIAFSPDSLRIATASDDRTARVWDARSGSPLTPPLKHSDQVSCISFSADGRLVATGSKDRTARIWDSTSGEPLTPPLPHGANLRSVAFSPDHRWVATASSDRTARVWNVADGEPASPPLRHASNVHWAAFDRAGSRLITASRDGTARVWELSPLNNAERRMPHEGQVSRVIISPDGKHVATRQFGVKDGILLWNLEAFTPTLTRRFPGFCAGFSPDGRYLATSGRVPELWDLRTGQLSAELIGTYPALRCAVFSPDGRLIVTGEEERRPLEVRGNVRGAMRFWDRTQAKPLGPPIMFSEGVRQIAFSADGRRVVVCWSPEMTDRGAAQVFDVATRQPVSPPIHHRGTVSQAAFSPDGKRLVTGYADPSLSSCEAQVWNPLTGVPIAPRIQHRDGVSAASFSPDGKWIVTASEDTTARVWNSFTSQPRTPPLQHGAQVEWAEFSPDGKLVLTASIDKTARVWDASTGQLLTPPLRHDGPVRHATFFKDGRRIATASEDHTARIWKLSKDERPASELLLLAELLTAHEIDPTGGLVPLDLPAIRARWQKLRAK